MNHSTHPVTREEVMALQDGELAGKEWEAVAGHVAFCRECNGFLKEMEETSRELRNWRVGELREEAEQRVMAAAKELKPKKTERNWKSRIAGFASGFVAGPASEAAQTILAYLVQSVSNPALFAVQPAVAVNGTAVNHTALGINFLRVERQHTSPVGQYVKPFLENFSAIGRQGQLVHRFIERGVGVQISPKLNARLLQELQRVCLPLMTPGPSSTGGTPRIGLAGRCGRFCGWVVTHPFR